MRNITLAEKPLLRQLLTLYLAELFPDQKELDYPYLDHYWLDENRHPFFIINDDTIAGFVLVNQMNKYEQTPQPHCIAEFYIKPSYRRQGLGQQAATLAFSRFGGNWEVKVLLNQTNALKFWRSTIQKCTNGRFKEIRNEQEGNFFLFFFRA